jgi:hypothetical protein
LCSSVDSRSLGLDQASLHNAANRDVYHRQ